MLDVELDLNHEFIQKLLQANPKALNTCYKDFRPGIINMIIQNGGTEDDAKDVFQESLLLMIRKLSEPTFFINCKAKTFLYGIAKYKWFNERKKQEKTLTVSDDVFFNQSETFPEIDWDKEELKKNKINDILAKLNLLKENCRNLIKAFYMEGLSISEITSWAGLSSEEYTKLKKFRCMEKLRSLI